MPARCTRRVRTRFLPRILQKNTLSRAQDVLEHRPWQIINAVTGLPHNRPPRLSWLLLASASIR